MLRPDGFSIRQDGAPGSDLSGNSELGVTMRYTGDDWASTTFHRFKKLFDDKGAVNPWATVVSSTYEHFYPNVTADVVANVEFNFLFRDVRTGRRHIPESRQHVTHAFGRSPTNSVTLLKPSDLKPTVYKLVAGANVLMFNKVEVTLPDAAAAAQLVTWLRMTSALPAAFTITISGGAIVPASLSIKKF
ncbi:MAG: hypothetical protein IPP83_07245 [Flavobacteriales bacterium]|nr:hypothetical protein [Flavobacteriales bacterium]